MRIPSKVRSIFAFSIAASALAGCGAMVQHAVQTENYHAQMDKLWIQLAPPMPEMTVLAMSRPGVPCRIVRRSAPPGPLTPMPASLTFPTAGSHPQIECTDDEARSVPGAIAAAMYLARDAWANAQGEAKRTATATFDNTATNRIAPIVVVARTDGQDGYLMLLVLTAPDTVESEEARKKFATRVEQERPGLQQSDRAFLRRECAQRQLDCQRVLDTYEQMIRNEAQLHAKLIQSRVVMSDADSERMRRGGQIR